MKTEDLKLMADAIDEHCVQRLEAIEERLDALESASKQAEQSLPERLARLETEVDQ